MNKQTKSQESLYLREKTLRAAGLEIRRANHFEEYINEYGEKHRWVIDNQPFASLKAFKTKREAIEYAEMTLY